MYAMVPTKAQTREKQIDALAKTKEVKKYLKLMAERFVEASENKPRLTKEESIIESRLADIRHTMIVKGKEYQRNGDKLHNFRRAAEMQRSNMPRVLHGMLQKHLVSYYDMLDDIDLGKKIKDEYISEKLGDILIYILLQEVAIKEEMENQALS